MQCHRCFDWSRTPLCEACQEDMAKRPMAPTWATALVALLFAGIGTAFWGWVFGMWR